MKKIVVWSMLVLIVTSSPAFAQINWGKLGKNFGKNVNKQVENQITREAILNSTTGVRPASLPAHLKLGSQAFVNSIKKPQADLVNASYLYKAKRLADHAKSVKIKLSDVEVRRALANEWIQRPGQNVGAGVFYDNQAQLARDLNEFYGGSGSAVEVGGKLLKLYALPIDKILYKPAGRNIQVITSEEYFVVYDPAAKTGQLVKKTPETLQQFSQTTNSGTFEEVTVLGGQVFYMPDGEPDWEILKGVKKTEKAKASEPEGDFEEVYGELLPEDFSFGGVSHMATPEELKELEALNEQAALEAEITDPSFGGVSRPGTPEEVYQFKKLEYEYSFQREDAAAKLVWKKGDFPTSFTSQDQLGKHLHRFHRGFAAKVQDVITKQVKYVYEIPVQGLTLIEENGFVSELDPAREVVLYDERTGGQVVMRDIVEAQQLYKFVQ